MFWPIAPKLLGLYATFKFLWHCSSGCLYYFSNSVELSKVLLSIQTKTKILVWVQFFLNAIQCFGHLYIEWIVKAHTLWSEDGCWFKPVQGQHVASLRLARSFIYSCFTQPGINKSTMYRVSNWYHCCWHWILTELFQGCFINYQYSLIVSGLFH